MKINLLSLIFVFLSTILLAQKPAYLDFKWSENPDFKPNSKKDKEILKQHEIVEFIHEDN